MRTFTHLVSLTIGSVCGKDISALELPSLKYLTVNSCKYTKWMEVGDQFKYYDFQVAVTL